MKKSTFGPPPQRLTWGWALKTGEGGTITESPRIGIGYRATVHDSIIDDLAEFDVLEITLDHYFWGDPRQRAGIESLVGKIPLVSHGVGLSLGTDCPPDTHYLDRIARLIERLEIPYYSEHLAFTGVPGMELSNLLPMPRNDAAAELAIAKVKAVQRVIPVPLVLENITRYFDWPDNEYDEASFLNLIVAETGIEILLDVENLYVNECNLGTDAMAFIRTLDADCVRALHIAGGGYFLDKEVDTHDHAVPDGAYDLLSTAVERFAPEVIILERDRRLNVWDEILHDVRRIRAHAARRTGQPEAVDG